MTTGRINQVVAKLLSCINLHNYARFIKVTHVACSCSAHMHTNLISSKTAVNQKNTHTHKVRTLTMLAQARLERSQGPPTYVTNYTAPGQRRIMKAAHSYLALLQANNMPHNSLSVNSAQNLQHVCCACTNCPTAKSMHTSTHCKGACARVGFTNKLHRHTAG